MCIYASFFSLSFFPNLPILAWTLVGVSQVLWKKITVKPTLMRYSFERKAKLHFTQDLLLHLDNFFTDEWAWHIRYARHSIAPSSCLLCASPIQWQCRRNPRPQLSPLWNRICGARILQFRGLCWCPHSWVFLSIKPRWVSHLVRILLAIWHRCATSYPTASNYYVVFWLLLWRLDLWI